MERERLGSRLGFILLSAGCAIGLGNVWKFPYMVGENGGGIFVLIYILFLLVIGAPVLTMEYAMGRASQKSPVKMYDGLEPKGSKWHNHGYIAMAGCYILMMFYTVIAGWMIKYFFASTTGEYSGLDPVGVADYFGQLTSDPVLMFTLTAIVVVIGFLVCSLGVKNCLERVTKYMMLLLLALMVILVIHSFTMEGAPSGLEFYLMPDVDKFLDAGVVNVIIAAMSQAFFTLSIGMGSMAIFGSYIDRKRSLLGEAVTVGTLDTSVALMSGLIIFPACFTFGIDVQAGPRLIFITLPNVFNNMPMGELWGSLFFLFMCFAALSTVFAVFECIVACTMDVTGWDRRRASLVNCAMMLVLVLPCILGFNVLSGFQPFGPESNMLDLEDFIVSYVILPSGALIFTIFCATRYGWGWERFKAEANQGNGLKVAEWMRPYVTYVLPVIIAILFVTGIVNTFI